MCIYIYIYMCIYIYIYRERERERYCYVCIVYYLFAHPRVRNRRTPARTHTICCDVCGSSRQQKLVMRERGKEKVGRMRGQRERGTREVRRAMAP